MHAFHRLASVLIFALVGCGGSVTEATGTEHPANDAAASDATPSDGEADSSPADSAPSDTTPTPTPTSGGDRDAHGCIPSAGYQWCSKEMKCVRPFELATEKGFPNTPEDFAKYCGG